MTSPLEEIDRKVLQIYALVGESVSGATHALLAGDREAAKALALRDEVIDSICEEIEELALQQLTVGGITSPSQLRYLTTVIRMLPDLERNGDLAEHVARRAARGLGAELSARSRGLIERMGEVAVNMWRATTDAYADREPSAADVVEDLDDEMDDLHVSLTMEVVAGTMPLPVSVELALLARFYERFGDHAVNLARRMAGLAGTLPRTGQQPAGTTDPPG
jgi:phosphate transport system protein